VPMIFSMPLCSVHSADPKLLAGTAVYRNSDRWP
jgi:hypothetical protein